MKLEKAPNVKGKDKSLGFLLVEEENRKAFEKAQREYLYWDKVKHLKLSEDTTHKEFWDLVKYTRSFGLVRKEKFGKYEFRYSLTTTYIEKTLHDFDRNYGNPAFSNSLEEADKQKYLISSIMEEAIASSQIEGASTTRKAAKQMLMEERPPRNKSELMILNNYKTIQRIKELKDEPLTPDLLLEIHRLITLGTLDNKETEGDFRKTNDIFVVDADGEIAHIPPTFEELPELIQALCNLFNRKEGTYFTHPIIKACIIHFMIGYIHPFVDGNGRTARALFYWHMLKKGYWLTEYLSISSIILKQKAKYARAFLYTETDDNDLTYFINYKMEVLESAYKSLMEYIGRKLKEKKAAAHFLKLGNINERQALILQWLDEDSDRVIKVKEIENYFVISNQTARNDLQDLVAQGYLTEQQINQKQKIFLKANK